MERPDELIDAARAETGLDHFGDDSFREGLEILVRALREEATLNAAGDMVLGQLIVGYLGQRLQIEDWYRRHPEIDDEPIDAPLIGLGLPRTGSTALSALLGEDPNARSLRRWESAQPCPPPSTVEGPDPRIAKTEAEVELQRQTTPRMLALVPTSATSPFECQDLMALDFRSHLFQAFAFVPSYSKWLLDADLTSTYQYERRTLKLLQWGDPVKPWRLKCPTHLLFLRYLDKAFPDARFVMTHRDPADVILSVADVYAEVAKMFSDEIDHQYLGRLNVEHWSVGMERALAFRDAGADARFFDIDFRAMQRDPIGEVQGLYRWLGEPVTAEFEAGMRRWWHENAEHREEHERPDPDVYGIDLERVRPLFADYVARMHTWTGRQEDMTIDLTGGLHESREYLFPECPAEDGMRDAVNMWVSDDRGEVGLPRFAVEALAPGWDRHELQVNVALPDGRVYRLRGPHPSHPVMGPDGQASVLGTGPLAFRCVEPFRRWTAEFDGTAIETSTEALIAGDPDGPRVDLAFRVEAAMAVPPWIQGTLFPEAAEMLATSIEGKLMGGPRFEQLFRATGTVRAGDEEHTFTGSGLRIRRQGIRDVTEFWGHCWQSALFPSGRAFGYIAYPPRPDGSESYNEGYLFTGDGDLIPAKVLEAPWLTSLVPNGDDVSFVLESDLGVTRIEGETVFSTFEMGLPDFPQFPILYQGGVRYRWDGEETYGMLERSSMRDKIDWV